MPRKLLKFLIIFDNTSLLYFPGQFLSGRVLLELSDETPALGLHFHVVGEGVVRVQNVRDLTDDREKYIDFKMRLLGSNDGEVTVLSPGIHSFPFKLGLPYGLPSTFLGRFGWIQYFCKAALREPTGLLHKNHQVFIVMNPIDLNLEFPALSVSRERDTTLVSPRSNSCSVRPQKPFTAELSHNVGSNVLSCFSPSNGGAGNKNKVHCKVMLDRGGYVPGENVMLSAKVVNQSPMKIKGTRVCLTETIEYFMHKKKTRTERRDLVVIKRGKIRPFTMDEMSEKIYIPPLPPTNLQGCNLINISYDVFVSLLKYSCQPHPPLTFRPPSSS